MNLETKIEEFFKRLSDSQKKALKKLKLETISDLLYHFPSRYITDADIKSISNIKKGDSVVLYGKITKLKASKAYYKKIPMAEGILEDSTGKIKVIWFNQPYLAKMIKENSLVKLEGKVAEKRRSNADKNAESRGSLYITNPEVKPVSEIPINSDNSLFNNKQDGENLYSHPFYPESKGITSKWFHHAINKIFNEKFFESIEDPIPKEILKKYNLPSLKTSLIWIHTPKKKEDSISAKKRFAFEEVFYIQLQKQKQRKEYEKEPSFKIKKSEKDIKEFMKRFPFEATNAQKKAIKDVLEDFETETAMSRLLEGDVGSGKTAVAATTAYSVVTTNPNGQNYGNLQVAYMVPTEILAKQHFESFIEYFNPPAGGLNINIGLITSSGCKKFPSKVSASWRTGQKYTDISRSQLLKWVQNGEIPVLIGTHSLIQKSVKFKNLAYVIIDEQHRFGVNQRKALVRRSTQIETQIKADMEIRKNIDKKDNFLYKDLTYALRNIAFTIHNELGSGHKENVYQNAFEEELKKRKIPFEKEKSIDVIYNKKKIGTYRPDFVIDKKIIIEIKALPFTGNREKKQTWNYLKGSFYNLALLINFGKESVDISRIVYETARKNLRKSATNLQTSAQMWRMPHLLSMTATPIPRTLALTIYGDLDLTLLDEMPKGRKKVITELISSKDSNQTYEEIRERLNEGKQMYVICPRIEEPDPDKLMTLNVKSVKEEAKRLKKDIFPEFEIEILHSKITPKKKEEILQRFIDKKINILVSTSVIEVGVNIPNATMIIIEGAERFGLAQLHQLRGRVMRSSSQAYCYIFTDKKSGPSFDRLNALKTTKNGFELAERDLELRGSGQLIGGKQWGISDIGMEAIKNLKMVKAARNEAKNLVEKDVELKKYPKLKERIDKKFGQIHFE